MHVAIQSGAGIPARLFLVVFEANGQCVVFAVFVQQIGNIEIKRVVAVGPKSGFFSVHIHTCLAHCSIELNFHTFISREIRNGKVVSVPSGAGKRKSAGAAIMLNGRGLSVLHNSHPMDIVRFVERPVNCPIVRHGYRLPLGIIEIDIRLCGIVFAGKFPPFFQGNLVACLCFGKGSGCQKQHSC